MRLVVALGGNALLRRGEALNVAIQRQNIASAAGSLASLTQHYEIVVTHGNGPQVGLLAMQAEALQEAIPYPLDVLGAESEGLIGYLLEEGLSRVLPDRDIATLLTRVEVDPADPAFECPTKPIGPRYREIDAKRLAAQRGWTFAPDGAYLRRVVPSPKPKRILGVNVLRRLIDDGVLVICAGGGGIPVANDGRGLEAVIDKDWTAAILAQELNAEGLVLLTDVTGVFENFRAQSAAVIRRTTPDKLSQMKFEEGSMAPKVAAACWFVAATGGWAAIGHLEEAAAVVSGTCGTRIECR